MTFLRRQHPRVRSVAMSWALAWLVGCANQIPPAGGPLDEQGPQIIATWPDPFTVNFTGDRVELTFDEYVDQRSFEESVFITPVVDDIEFEWSGRTVELIFRERLRDSTTYVISIGTDVVDLESTRRNRMRETFTFALSTGPTVDRGLLAGRVYPRQRGDEVSGIMVLAYHLGGMRSDTLNPLTTTPTYATQTGSDGSFRLPHIRLGSYRLLALRDEFRNLLYDRETDEYAVPSADVRLTQDDTARAMIVMQLGKEDTTGPRLVGVEPKDRNQVAVEFSEEVDTTTSRAPVLSIIDTLDGRSVPVFLVLLSQADPKKGTVICDYLTADRPYVIRADRLFDRVGNPARVDGVTRTFVGPSNLDTLAPRLVSVSPRDSSRDLDPRLSLEVSFSQPILAETMPGLSASFVGADSQKVRGEVVWPTANRAIVSPSRSLGSEQWYTAALTMNGLQDWKTARIADTVVTLRFATRDPGNDGSIEGIVEDASSNDTSGSIMVTVREAKSRSVQMLSSKASGSGTFRLQGLPAGRFIVYAYRDRNENGRLDPGLPFPLSASERRSLDSDTLRVRPRWPLEGLRIRIPR